MVRRGCMLPVKPIGKRETVMPRITHFEIHAGDPERAMAFYKEVLEWTFQKIPGPVDYWYVVTGEDDEAGINGGLHPRRGDIDGEAVIAYVCTAQVDDVDDYVARAEQAGGKSVVPKTAIPHVGWLAYCKDTEGNIFGLMQPDINAK
jgi:predicted enzyme related to lactoylglutathione lyase